MAELRQSTSKNKQGSGVHPAANSRKYPLKNKDGRKPKNEHTSLLVPEHRRIFNGLKFFFVPNNDISPTRRIRIRKAIEFGASWIREWSLDVDYIIVDQNITIAEVLRFINLSELPTGVIAVNEFWPPACMSDGCLVDHTAACHRLTGSGPPAISQDLIALPALNVRPEQGDVKTKLTVARDSTPIHEIEAKEVLDNDTPAPCLEEQIQHQQGQIVSKCDYTASGEDPLEEYITRAKASAHLPLDSYDESPDQWEEPNESNESSSESSERSSPAPRAKRPARASQADRQSKFQCMQPHNMQGTKPCPNQRTIDVLQEMQGYYNTIRDEWRSRAYRMAIATLRKQTTMITTKEEAQSLPLIGERLATKIEEIARTNRLRRLENIKLSSEDKALKLFLDIYGVGFSQAMKWVQAGFRSLQDLVEAKTDLTHNQMLGIAHYGDFRMRIPRQEVEQLGDIVQKTLEKIDDKCEMIIGGSYRRGSKDCGDIDILITKPQASLAELRVLVLDRLVPKLEKAEFLVAALAVTNRETGSKWHGACQLPLSNEISPIMVSDKKVNHNPWRRIDFLLVPFDEIGAAKIYFTGNDIFNRSMRLLARTKGMSLNQKGLYKDVMRQRAVKLTTGTKVEGEDEHRIFEILGVPWREPCERNI